MNLAATTATDVVIAPATHRTAERHRTAAWTESYPVLRGILVVVALAIVPYTNALRSGFTFDDGPVIVDNSVVTDGVDVPRIWASSQPPGDLYRPMTIFTFAINHALTPGNPLPFHAVNLVVHAAVSVLVFLLGLALFGTVRTAVIAAALFAVHPIHTEAVTNLVGRAELLAAFFGLLTLLSVAAADRAAHRSAHLLFLAGALVSFSLALCSKESAVTVLALIPLLRVTLRREPLVRGLWHELRGLDWLPFALCAGLFVAVRCWVIGGLGASTVSPLDNALAFVPAAARIRTALGVLWDYFGLLNVPLVLAADYSFNQIPVEESWLTPRIIAGAALIAAPLLVAVRNRRPVVTFAALFPLVALSLTANLLFPIGTIKAERFLYLPSVGWVLLVASVIERLLHTRSYRRAAAVGLLGVVALYAGRTWLRNWDWMDNASLYRSMAWTAPNSAKARYNFGIALQQEERDDAAAAQFHRALEIFPWDGGAGSALGLGILAEKSGAMNEAAGWYRKALEIESGFGKAHTNLCRVLLLSGEFAAATRACRTGLRYEPTDANLMKGVGESLLGIGEVERGLAVLRRALALTPGDADLRARIDHLDATLTQPGRTVQ